MSTWKVPVVRTAVQTRYITVEADTLDGAYEKALEEAPSEDWTGDTSSSEYALDDMYAELVDTGNYAIVAGSECPRCGGTVEHEMREGAGKHLEGVLTCRDCETEY